MQTLNTTQWRIIFILALALLLRMTALNWGLPEQHHLASFHPDESAGIDTIKRFINNPLDTSPYAYTKGTGYFYVSSFAVQIARAFGFIQLNEAGQPKNFQSHRRIYFAARLVTLGFSLGTVLLVFLIGRLSFNRITGELAALIIAISPISVLDAHYVKTDTPETFWIILTLYFAQKSQHQSRWLLAALFTSGIAGAFKYPGISAIILVIFTAFLLNHEEWKKYFRILLLGWPP